MTLSRIFYLCFGGGAFALFTLTYLTSETWYAYIAAPLFLLLVVSYIMSPQIDWWYFQRRPPSVDDNTRTFLNKRLPFYHQLNDRGKKRFEERVAMFLPAHEFVPMEVKSVPDELQVALAASAVQLTFG
ncbi:MAG: zinc-dependent peptidase, partial [Bacteroidota bacterium]